MKKLSKNIKLNYVLNNIYEDLEEIGNEEIKRYIKEFPKEIDFNIAQYANMLIYFEDIQNLYKKAGYKTKFSNYEIWEIYKRQVGYIVRNYFNN